MSRDSIRKPRFDLGRPAITPAAQTALDATEISAASLLTRHLHGDWGDLSVEDQVANELAALSGKRILSSYPLRGDERVWVITEADRSATTILSPDDY